jgi:hypothetical protein
MHHLRRQLEEISADPRLRVFGAILAGAQVLVAVWWWKSALAATLAPGAEALCWPFFPHCGTWRLLSAPAWKAVVIAYGALGLIAIFTLARRRTVALGLGLLALLELARLGIVLQDFRLRLNQHYMAFFAGAVFLLLPNKRRNLRLLVVLFYFWAGLLKLNREWLTGAALYARPWLVPETLIPAACAYVVVLELVISWGLLAKHRWVFWASLAQLVLFSICSVPVVGFLYPLVMLGLLAIFPLARTADEPSPLRAFVTGQERPVTYAMVALFSALQLWPRLQGGDPAITGEGRWLSLHMFDAKVQCVGYAMLETPRGIVDRIDLVGALATRIHCDPIVYLDRARALCEQIRHAGATAIDVDLELDSKRSSDARLRPVLRLRHFCSAPPDYSAFGFNRWIRR